MMSVMMRAGDSDKERTGLYCARVIGDMANYHRTVAQDFTMLNMGQERSERGRLNAHSGSILRPIALLQGRVSVENATP